MMGFGVHSLYDTGKEITFWIDKKVKEIHNFWSWTTKIIISCAPILGIVCPLLKDMVSSYYHNPNSLPRLRAKRFCWVMNCHFTIRVAMGFSWLLSLNGKKLLKIYKKENIFGLIIRIDIFFIILIKKIK